MKKLCFFIALFCAFLDQVIKVCITWNMKLYQSIPIINNFFSITYVKNDGAAFSLFRNKTHLLLIISFIVIIFLIYYIIKQNKLTKLEAISYGLLLGGIIGNFIDRLLVGQVIDYLDFTFFSYHYPVFNLADSTIVVGIILLCFIVLRRDLNDRRKN